MTSYWYTKFLMPVPRRYFRLAELNGDSNPQRGCNISFYSSYTFVINTNNAKKIQFVGSKFTNLCHGSGSKVKHARQQGVDLRKYTAYNECANGASNPVS